MGHIQTRHLALMSVYLILSRVTRAAGAVPASSWAAVACPTRVVTNEDETARVILLGAWVRGGGVGNGTDAGTDDRHPSIASLRITSEPEPRRAVLESEARACRRRGARGDGVGALLRHPAIVGDAGDVAGGGRAVRETRMAVRRGPRPGRGRIHDASIDGRRARVRRDTLRAGG